MPKQEGFMFLMMFVGVPARQRSGVSLHEVLRSHFRLFFMSLKMMQDALLILMQMSKWKLTSQAVVCNKYFPSWTNVIYFSEFTPKYPINPSGAQLVLTSFPSLKKATAEENTSLICKPRIVFNAKVTTERKSPSALYMSMANEKILKFSSLNSTTIHIHT